MEITFAGNAKTVAGRRLGRDFEGVSLSPIRIGRILYSDIQSGAAEKVVEPQVDVLGQVFLDAGRPYRAGRTLCGGALPIVGGSSIGITEDLMSCVESLGLFNGIHRTAVKVRVVLFGQQSVGNPDLLVGAAAVEAQRRVMVGKGRLQRSVSW